jgi:hypothetical protein
MYRLEQLVWWLVERLMQLAWVLKDRRLERYARKRK